MEMSKLEKTIKGFTICSEHGLLNGKDCHGHYEYTDNLADIIKVNDYSKQCPYNGCKTGCVKTLAKGTLALLKEQEAKKVLQIRNVAYRTIGYCPSCGRGLDSYEDGNSGDHITNYCYNCGQAVKWNE